MRYFIGYLLEGESAEWCKTTARQISEKFNTRKIYEKIPPHITIFKPFDVDDITPIKSAVQKWSEREKILGNVSVVDFGHFDDKVIFAKVVVDENIRREVLVLQNALEKILEISASDFPVWQPHITVVNHVEPEEIKKIWRYVQALPKPHFRLAFDAVAIFCFEGDTGWVVEESFKIQSI